MASESNRIEKHKYTVISCYKMGHNGRLRGTIDMMFNMMAMQNYLQFLDLTFMNSLLNEKQDLPIGNYVSLHYNDDSQLRSVQKPSFEVIKTRHNCFDQLYFIKVVKSANELHSKTKFCLFDHPISFKRELKFFFKTGR